MFVFNSFSLDFSKFVQFLYSVEFRLRVSKFRVDVYSFTWAFNACWECPMLEEYHGVQCYMRLYCDGNQTMQACLILSKIYLSRLNFKKLAVTSK